MMSSIHFNPSTKEMEIQGAESFIQANFFQIRDLLIECFGGKSGARGKPGARTEPPVLLAAQDSGIAHVSPDKPPARESAMASRPLPVKRPPLRKYFNAMGQLIRSEDTSIDRHSANGPDRKTPAGISAASLKEKFGLSEEQIEGIIRDAQRQGKIQQDRDGSYIWR